MDEKNLMDMLYVGTVYVDVGYDGGGPTARTANSLLFGAMDLGGEISVRLPQYAFGDPDDLGEDDPPLGSVGMWKMLLTDMRDMLASCMIFGEMEVVVGELLSIPPDKEEDKNLDEAILALADGDDDEPTIKITPEHAVKALRKRARDEEAVTEWFKWMVEFIEAQQQRPDENITLEEAEGRFEEGTERLKRMVDPPGDEEEPETES